MDETSQALLNANVRLTEVIVQLATKVIESGLSPVVAVQAPAPAVRPFEFTTGDDWPDVMDKPGEKLHIPEEEEDARFEAAIGGITGPQLEEALKQVNFLSTEVEFAPPADPNAP